VTEKQSKTVMVIDDEIDMASLMKMELEMEGYRVLVSNNGKSGLMIMQEDRPDLILLDLMMTGLDGFGVLEELKKNETMESIPVLIVSARGTDQDIQQALDLGANDYICKPFHPAVLLKKVKAFLEQEL